MQILMQTIRGRCAVISLALVAVGSPGQAVAALKYDPAKPIYDDDKSSHAVGEVGTLLADADSKGQRVLIYLHGRGDEPEKSFNAQMTGGGAVARLHNEFGVRVLLVNWRSKAQGKDRDEPLSHVAEGAETLRGVLEQLVDFQKLKPNARKPALLVHSMGSIVLSTQILTRDWPAGPGASLFSNVLLSEPDADSQGHAAWLSKLAARERVYVTQSERDSVLKESTDARSPGTNFALGLEPVAPLAEGAFYVDLTRALKIKKVFFIVRIGAHQIFSKAWMGGNVNTCRLISQSLRGERFEPDAIDGIHRTGPGRYQADEKLDKKDPCFDNADPDGDQE